MINAKRWSNGLAVVLLCGVSSAAFAAIQGDKGSTSTGSATVSANVPTKIQITNVQDFIFGEWSGEGGFSSTASNICVWSTSHQYALTASGSLTDNAFGMTGVGGDIPFTVEWSGVTGTLSPGVATPILAAAKSATCNANGDPTASMTVTVTEAAMQEVTIGQYSGTVTLTVATE